MTCPRCGLENIPSAGNCDCGQSFAPTALTEEPARSFTVRRIFLAWGIGTVFVITEGVLSFFLPIPALWWFVPSVIEDHLRWLNGLIVGLVFQSIVFGAVAFWLLDWLYWRPWGRRG